MLGAVALFTACSDDGGSGSGNINYEEGYSLDGDNFIPFGHPYQLSWGNYRGDRIGVYCYNNNVESGYVDIDYFHYEME